MLERLRITNFALIDKLDIQFGDGLNVLTGATGAGKSIIIGAIGFAAGNKGSEEIIRTGADNSIVEAEFQLDENTASNDANKLTEYLTEENKITLKREYKKSGGKSFIGKKQVNLTTLKGISKELFSILGQHSHQALLDPSTHIRHLDNFANIQSELSDLKRLYKNALSYKEELSYARRNAREIGERIELLKFQISEIKNANLQSDEENDLKIEKKLLENSRQIKESGELAISTLLESDGSVVEKIGETVKTIRQVETGHNEIKEILGIISGASDSINEATIRIRNFIDNIDDDPNRLEEINARLQEIFRLKKKYDSDIRGLLEYAEKSGNELHGLKLKSNDPGVIEKKLNEILIKLNSTAGKISRKRKSAKKLLEELVSSNLSTMGMDKAQFAIEISSKEDPNGIYGADGNNLAGDASGFDLVEFFFCANPGEGLKQLTKIASGGEISRVMLALKNAFLKNSFRRCEIFDEIDVGISGEVASKVAEQLKELSRKHQVICITHLHQIAAIADQHFKVFKKRVKGRSVTIVKNLGPEERVEEIAALLSGKSITEKAIARAREIIGSSDN